VSVPNPLKALGRARFPLGAPDWPTGVDRPPPERKIGLDYDHEWSRRYPARLVRAAVLDNVTRPLAQFVAPSTVRGAEYLRQLDAPVIFAANHASHFDTPLLLTTLPTRFRHRTVVAAASDYFFDRRWKGTLWSLALAAIPIERSRVNRRSAEIATDLLRDHWNLVIFPEGGRTPDGWAQEFRGGAAYLALRTGAPVVPVYLHGTGRILPKRNDAHPGGSGTENKGRPLRRAPVTIMFGPPLSPHDDEDARRFGVRIERAIEVLAREVATDWWTARRSPEEAPDALHGPDAVPWRRAWALGPPPELGRDRPWPDVRLARLTGRRRRRDGRGSARPTDAGTSKRRSLR
jgi:1-acyl-sn-glycerol-3-phosphate acyltransferase